MVTVTGRLPLRCAALPLRYARQFRPQMGLRLLHVGNGISALGDGADAVGMAVLELLAKPRDVDGKVACVVSMSVTPGAASNGFARGDALLVAGEGVEDLKLHVREIYGVTIDPGEVCAPIDGQIAERQSRGHAAMMPTNCYGAGTKRFQAD